MTSHCIKHLTFDSWIQRTLAASVLASLLGAGAQAADIASNQHEDIPEWGIPVDPAGDCQFELGKGTFRITVPGSARPHDLSAEMNSMTAPRVLQKVESDFAIQVKIDGEFDPGGQSTQAGRTGYTGAGLVVFADEQNYVRLERATLNHLRGIPRPYINFEIRVNGRNQRFGTTADFQFRPEKPLWLRLQRKEGEMWGAFSHDGQNWTSGTPKQLDPIIWDKGELSAGIAAISTSMKPFVPEYSELKISSESKSE